MEFHENKVILKKIAEEISVSERQIAETLILLKDGGTVPFIARYRKEVTGNLDEVQIRGIEEKRGYYSELLERKVVILKTIEELGKLSPELKVRIDGCFEKNELEDLYLPYKPKRRTKATIAIDKGLEPLAKYMFEQVQADKSIEALAVEFVSEEKGVASAGDAVDGALHIIAEWVSENADFRKVLRETMMRDGVVVSRVVKGKETEKTKFEMYYDFREPAAIIPSHRMLAIRRGWEDGVLTFSIDIEEEKGLAYLKDRIIKDAGSVFAPYLERSIIDSYTRLLNPAIQTEVRVVLKKRSDEEAIRVFEENLKNLLLAPPAGAITVIGVDPGMRTGCKVAVIDETGKMLENTTIYPTEPRNDIAGAAKTLTALIQKYRIRGIAIGNGTGSRETEGFVRDMLKEQKFEGIFCAVVSEAGASVYSASDIARDEFPDLDLTVRGAISIARRLQDPLAELVKIDPKAIGVGQYQHDVDQKKLKQGLDSTVESSVNKVGVDLNTASYALLRYVAGINESVAKRVVKYREENGSFRSRQSLMNVSGFGEKTFQQSAGFLRVKGSDNPLDGTAVHPESYPVVEKMASTLGLKVAELLENVKVVQSLDIKQFTDDKAGEYTLNDIREELLKPGRDPREKFTTVTFRDDVKEITDLQEGMVLEGTVTNVTNFGAFVDIGVHQDGLIHISELSNKFIKDPKDAVRVGEIVKVKVITVDVPLKRIALSRKALLPQSGTEPRKTDRKEITQKTESPKSMTNQLEALKARFGKKF
ncbi:MAG: RNA-binding transcriptional accessory protein [Nitrospirae bacterium]|nr:RNA-binding transcriptional accessory protein [Nitrospirota bacterium]